jgi:hypothetical protein
MILWGECDDAPLGVHTMAFELPLWLEHRRNRDEEEAVGDEPYDGPCWPQANRIWQFPDELVEPHSRQPPNGSRLSCGALKKNDSFH